MTADAKALYQQRVMAHYKAPHNEGTLDPRTHEAKGDNPLCGDRVTVHLDLRDGRIEAIAFQVRGCAIAKASASMMTTVVKGRSADEARRLSARLRESLLPDSPPLPDDDPLAAFAGVRLFPTRTRCATLAWETLENALDSQR